MSLFEAAIQDNTKALYIETLGNPNSEVTDIEAVAKIAHAHNIPLIIDISPLNLANRHLISVLLQ